MDRDRHGASDRSAAPCDMILVDGDHSLQGATIDLQNFKPLAAGAPVIVDDIATDPAGRSGSLGAPARSRCERCTGRTRAVAAQSLPAHGQPRADVLTMGLQRGRVQVM